MAIWEGGWLFLGLHRLTSNVLSKRVKVGSVTLVPKWTQMLLLGSTGKIGAIGLVGKSHAVRYHLFGTFFPSLPP